MKAKSNNKLIFMAFSICMGGMIGAFLWLFFKLMSMVMAVVWEISI